MTDLTEATARQWNFLPSARDEAWGLFVTGIGSGAEPGGAPASGWRLHYLVRGAASLVVPDRRRQRVEAGDVVLLDAQGANLVPDPQHPCRIHTVDFAGDNAARWMHAALFGKPPRVIRVGFDENLLGLLVKLVEQAIQPGPDSGRFMAGILANLMARLEVAARLGSGAGRQGKLVQEARRLLSDPQRDRLDLESAAQELGVSYSWFRRAFRLQTGHAPERFRQIQRLDRACSLLSDSSLSVREISGRLGFSSQAYFARWYRKQTGLSPSVWRTRHLG
jgi:AraC-like DNA-binding protein